MIADAATDADMRTMAEAERTALEARSVELAPAKSASLYCPGRHGRAQRNDSKSAPAPEANEASLFAAICSGCMSASRRTGLEGRGNLRSEGTMAAQGDHRRGAGPRRLRQLKFDPACTGAAGCRHRNARAHSYVGRNGAVLPEVEEVDVDHQERRSAIETMRAGAPAASTSTRPSPRSASPYPAGMQS